MSGYRTFCDWKFGVIYIVITKYHKIIISYFENVAIFQIFIYWYFKILFCWSALFISFFAVYYLLAYLYAKLFTVFVYGSWICIFCYEYIWKPVYCKISIIWRENFALPTDMFQSSAFFGPHCTHLPLSGFAANYGSRNGKAFVSRFHAEHSIYRLLAFEHLGTVQHFFDY